MRKASGRQRSEPRTDEQSAEDALSDYRRKRDPLATTEPFGAERPGSAAETHAGSFVVHLHHASRVHYDLRLEVGRTLKSFAVPKGPSLYPLEKRLAVLTEDHPLEYLDFEDVIPEGNYGAGPMIVWDMGRVRYPEASAESGLASGKIDFDLFGFKLRGRFALVRTKGSRGSRARASRGQEAANEWLLIKKEDVHASTQGNIVEDQPRSVLSGLTVEDLPARERIAADLVAQARSLGAAAGALDVTKTTPMLCATSGAELEDPERLYELKLDGVRILAEKSDHRAWLRYRSGAAATASYPEIARAVRGLAPDDIVLDGEIVAFDDRGRPSFERLGPRIHARRLDQIARARAAVPVVFVVFDVLRLGGLRLLQLPLGARKELLMQTVRGSGFLRALDHLEGDGGPLYELCRRERLEGVVAKRIASPYRPGPIRTNDWVKIKCERDEDFVIVGWTEGNRSRERLGALHLGSYVAGELTYRGRVGSGLDAESIEVLVEALEPRRTEDWPLAGEPPEDVQNAPEKSSFVRPELVARVRFAGFTEEGRLRAPVYLGLRNDVSARECTAGPSARAEALDGAGGAEQVEGPTAEPQDPRAASVASARAPSRVLLSNQDKVFWPREGYTKGDLCTYYAAVADWLLPFLSGRPVVLVRYPDGIEGKHFYQWRAPPGTPEWIRRIDLYRDEDEAEGERRGHRETKEVFLIDSQDALLHVANLGCIPLHVLASREGTPGACDFLTIDFDLGEQPLEHAVRLAFGLRELLDELGLTGFPKTSGQKGLHVLIPMGPGVSFAAAKLMNELLGRLLTARHPDLATMERRVSERGPKVYVDTGQTGTSRTIVAPYSVRAVPGATVSTPLFWEEIHIRLDPGRFHLESVPARLRSTGDPMARILEQRPDVPAALARLDALVRGS